MTIIKTNKNSGNTVNTGTTGTTGNTGTTKNTKNETYSFELLYKKNGNPVIQKSVGSKVTFPQFLDEYHKISKEVFPPPPKQTNANRQAPAIIPTNVTGQAPAIIPTNNKNGKKNNFSMSLS
jgi:hypothetical protein